MDETERILLLSKNPKSLLETLPKTFKRQLMRIEESNFNYSHSIGGYLQLKESKLDSLLKAKANVKESNPDYYKASIYNLQYLKKIITLCKAKNLNVFLIRSPLYKDSYYLSNEDLLQNIKQNQFADIKFFDFKDFPLSNDEYRDLNHINYKGSAKFSTWFNTMLKDSITTDFKPKD